MKFTTTELQPDDPIFQSGYQRHVVPVGKVGGSTPAKIAARIKSLTKLLSFSGLGEKRESEIRQWLKSLRGELHRKTAPKIKSRLLRDKLSGG